MTERAAPRAAVPSESVLPSDEVEFRRFFDDYAPRLRAYFLRRGASPSSAEELVQEVMLTVWNKADAFDPDRAAVSTWIYSIARNKHVDSLRRTRAEPDPRDPLWVTEPSSRADGPESSMAATERQRRLRAAIDDLPDELRVVLLALYYQGKSMSEFAAETSTALGTIKTRARRALAALRERMGNE